MPAYRVRYVCETALQADTDAVFEYEKHRIAFQFAKGIPQESAVHVSIDVEADNCREAESKAQSLAQPVLDAVAFSTNSPLLLLHWNLILKGEKGSQTRRALWCQQTKQPTRLQLDQRAKDEAQEILSRNRPPLELCWHRYALQRNLILDRFVFQWLAFEGLAGTKEVPTICPTCRKAVTHCDRELVHGGSDRDKAYQLLARIEPEISDSDFRKRVWGEIRNSVFHGTKYPSSALLQSLILLSPKLRRACEVEFGRRFESANQKRAAQELELYVYRHNMFEWQTKSPELQFGEDFPWLAIEKEFGNMQHGEIRAAVPEKWPFRVLDLERDSQGW